MSHQDLFTSLLSMSQPQLTSLSSSTSSKSTKSSTSTTIKPTTKTSKSTTKPSKSHSRRPSISSSITSEDDESQHSHTNGSGIQPYQQRKRKYDDNQEIEGDTPLNKKLRRQQQNRQAAHTSRIKKKAQMDALQQQVSDLIEANRVLRDKLNSLQSEVTSNRALLTSSSSSSPSPSSSPISPTSSNPDSPHSPMMMKSPSTPLSDSETSSIIEQSSISTLPSITIPSTSQDTHMEPQYEITQPHQESSISTSTPSSQSMSTISTSPVVNDTNAFIPSSISCYEPAVFALSPQCQPMENGINTIVSTYNNNNNMTWPQFTAILCILNTVWSATNTFRSMNNNNKQKHTSVCSILSSLPTTSPLPTVTPPATSTPHSISSIQTSRMSGHEQQQQQLQQQQVVSTLCVMMVIMAMSRVTQPGSMKVS